MNRLKIKSARNGGDRTEDSLLVAYLSRLQFGDLQTFENMGVLPLFVDIDDGPEYILLKDAIEEKQITITEVSQRGSVPTLKVVNKSPQFVLLLDGEALVGAKQNRVLNTSILVNGNSEIVIPVSCTEQGRWAYTSPVLSHADLIMSHRGRAGKASASR